MSHNIYMNGNGAAAMAYTGQRPWHGLGQELPAGATIEEWIKAAGFDFQIVGSAISYIDAHGQEHVFPNRRALYRSDTGLPISLVSSVYKVVQPADVMDFFAKLCSQAGWNMETAGVLGDGAKYWALARTNVDCSIAGDEHRGYMLLATSSDKSLATIASPTAVRVVCQNTLGLALHTADGNAVRIKHSTKFNVDAVLSSLGAFDMSRTMQDFSDRLSPLADVEISPTEATELFASLLRPNAPKVGKPIQDLQAQNFAELLQSPMSATPSAGTAYNKTDLPAADDIRAIRGLADLERSYYQAPGARPGTGYGVVQGITHWLDHERGKNADKRLQSAWFGQGAALKEKAVAAVEKFAVAD